ncbi:MAG: SU10 major capsid protein, partial [Bacteroidales bacterium]
TQYSWQIDVLNKPNVEEGFEEGSDALIEYREVTEVDYNFTSVLRKVVNISDTVSALGTHGRNNEIAYQMGKSGKELKRDMEFMCLNNGFGNVGTKHSASKFSGFSALCAKSPDPSTGALVTKEVSVADQRSPWFKASDIFDITYNLYLAGSKANKIMFHPRHALTFSQFMSNNIESPLTYRMFDGVDSEFNTKVSILRDPLAQKYDLISNRFMPEDKIYFFNESDWTQMILRQPAVSALGKKGSSDRFLLEAEIGLRHRNPYASGVLIMNPSKYIFEWIQKPTPMTWGVESSKEAIVSIKDRATGVVVPNGTVVTWTSSNPLIVSVVDNTGHVAGGQANALLTPHRSGTSIITASTDEGSSSYLLTVGNPNIQLFMANTMIEKDKGTLAIVRVTHTDGTPVKNGIEVSFTAHPGSLVNMPEKSNPTSGDSGTARVEVNAAGTLGLVQMQANIGDVTSNYARLEIVEKVEAVGMRIDQRNIALGINDSSVAEIFVLDALGAVIPNQDVVLASSNPSVIRLSHNTVNTGANGVYNLRLTGASTGSTTIIAEYKGQTFELPMEVREPVVLLAGPSEYAVGVEFSMTATVKRSDDTTVPVGTEINFAAIPAFSPNILTAPTNDQGVATVRYISASNSDYDVTATAGNTDSNTIVIRGPDLKQY